VKQLVYTEVVLIAVRAGAFREEEVPGLLKNFKLNWPEKTFGAEVS
jgi:hypothetical protein